MTDPSPPSADEQDLSIGQLLAMFWRGRWIILGTVALALALGALYVVRRGSIWRATCDFYVHPPQESSPDISALFGIASKNFAYTQAEVFQSEVVVKDALFGEGSLLSDLQVYPADATSEAQRVDWLRKELSVTVGRDDDVVSASLDLKDKESACALLIGVVRAFESHTRSLRQNNVEDFFNTYNARKGDLETEQASLEEKQDALLAEHPIDVERVSLQTLATSIRESQAELRDREDELERLAQARRVTEEFVPADARLSALVGSIRDLRQTRLDRSGFLQPEHPAMQQLGQAIATAEQELEQLEGDLRREKLAQIDLEIEAAQRRTGELGSLLARESEAYKGLSDAYREYDRLERALDLNALNQEEAKDAMRNLQSALSNASDPAKSVEVLNTPSPEMMRDVSGRSVRLALAMLLGLFGGAGIVWLRELLDQRIRSADEATRLLELPLLGAMPRVTALQGETESEALERWEKDRIYAEAARSLRTQVYFGLPVDEGRIIQLTSPDQGDGKSTTASHLSIAMATAGQRTLLIDADLRRPRQAEIFRVAKNPGLSDVLSGQYDEPSLPTRASGIEGLDVLSAGRVPPNPAEMLNHRRFKDLLDEAAKHYDRIVIDSPPVLPVADASILAPQSDTTILVLRAERSTRKRAEVALQTLQRVGGSVLGIVLNDVSRTGGYGRRYGYGYGYYASRYEQDQPEDLSRPGQTPPGSEGSGAPRRLFEG